MIYRPASSFYSNSIRLLSANVFSQSLTLLTFVLLARLYSVEDLGRFSFFLQLAALLTLLANGRYELVILLGKTRREATTAFQLCCMINIAVCVLILSPFLFFEHIRLLPLYIFVSALSASCSYWFNFNSRLSLIARYGIVQSLSANSLKALLGYIHPCVNGLLWADIIGYLVGIGSCITQKRLYSGIYYIHWREIWEMAYRFRHFPYFMLPLSLVNALSVSLPILVLAGYFSMEKIGFLSMALTLGVAPVKLWASSLEQVISGELTSYIKQKFSVSSLFRNLLSKIFRWLLPAIIFAFFLIPPAVKLFLGDDWEESAGYMQLLLPVLMAWFLSLSFISVPNLLGKQRMALILELLFIICRTIALMVGVGFHDFYLSVALYSAMYVVTVVIQFFWYARVLSVISYG